MTVLKIVSYLFRGMCIPFALSGLAGICIGFQCAWVGFRDRRDGLLLSTLLGYMVLWRLFYGIDSSRYAAGCALVILVFTVYAVSFVWIFRSRKWYNLAAVAVILVSVGISLAKLARISRNSKATEIRLAAERMRTVLADSHHPFIRDMAGWGKVLGYYSGIPDGDPLNFSEVFHSDEQTRYFLLSRYPAQDLNFYVFSKGKEAEALQKIRQKCPELKLRELPDNAERIYISVWYSLNDLPNIGKPVGLAIPAAGNNCAWEDDFTLWPGEWQIKGGVAEIGKTGGVQLVPSVGGIEISISPALFGSMTGELRIYYRGQHGAPFSIRSNHEHMMKAYTFYCMDEQEWRVGSLPVRISGPGLTLTLRAWDGAVEFGKLELVRE